MREVEVSCLGKCVQVRCARAMRKQVRSVEADRKM